MVRGPRPTLDALFVGFLLVSRASLASADGALEQVAAFDPTVRFGDGGAITFAPMLQTRWTASETGGAERATVVGFSVPRARLTMTTRLYETFRFRLRLGSTSNGSATFQQAYGEAKAGDFRFRAGQMPLTINAGEEPTVPGLSTADYSAYASTFAGGQTQGVELAFRGPVRVIATLSNGMRSGFSELLAPVVADVATTGRFEVPIGTQGLGDYDDQASFLRCQSVNARVGVTGHFQTRRRNGSPAYDLEAVSGDLGIRGSGFTVLASGSYLQMAPLDQPTAQMAGVMAFGSLLLERHVELFAQFDALFPLGDKAPFPPGFANNQPGTTMLRTVTMGSNFFLIPDRNRLKIQIDLQTMLDGQTTSIMPPNPARGVLVASGPQVAGRLQLMVSL